MPSPSPNTAPSPSPTSRLIKWEKQASANGAWIIFQQTADTSRNTSDVLANEIRRGIRRGAQTKCAPARGGYHFGCFSWCKQVSTYRARALPFNPADICTAIKRRPHFRLRGSANKERLQKISTEGWSGKQKITLNGILTKLFQFEIFKGNIFILTALFWGVLHSKRAPVCLYFELYSAGIANILMTTRHQTEGLR